MLIDRGAYDDRSDGFATDVFERMVIADFPDSAQDFGLQKFELEAVQLYPEHRIYQSPDVASMLREFTEHLMLKLITLGTVMMKNTKEITCMKKVFGLLSTFNYHWGALAIAL